MRRWCFGLAIGLILLINFTAAADDPVWRSIGPGGSGWFTKVAVDTLHPGTVFAGADVGGFYKSTDYGRSWRIGNTGLTDYYVQDIVIDPVNAQVVYLGTWGGVHKSTDNGETWQSKREGFPDPGNRNYTAPISTLAIDRQNPQVVYAGVGMPRLGPNDVVRWGPVPVKGAVYKSTDGGDSWRMIRNTGIDTTALIYRLAIHPTNPSVLYVTTHLGVYKSTDGGETWTLKNTGLPPIPDSVQPRDFVIDPTEPDRLYLTLWSDSFRNTGVWKTTNGGAVWFPCTTGISRTNFEEIVINAKDPAVLYASSTYGRIYGIYRTTNGGNSWDPISNHNVKRGWVRFYPQQPTGVTLNQQDTTMLFYTSASGVFKTTNLGLEWQPCYTESIGPDDNWKGTGLEVTCIRQITVDPVDSNLIYVALYDGGLLKTTDRGYSFKWIQDDMFYSETLPYPNNTTFSVAIHPRASEILYASAGRGDIPSSKLWRSTDYGENWVRCGIGLPESSHMSPILIDPNSTRDSTVIYLWASRYGVYKSTDGGQSWILKNNGLWITPGSDSFVHDHPQIMAMDRQNPSTLFLGVPKRQKVYKTTDGGDTWVELTLPRNLEPGGITLDPQNGNKVFLWARSSGRGGVFRSWDGGVSWEREPKFVVEGYYSNAVRCLAVSPFDTSLVMLGMHCHAQRDSSTGWGVFVSDDGGETYQEANQGLDCKRVFNLTFDPHHPHLVWLGTSGTGVYRGEFSVVPTEERDNAFPIYSNRSSPFKSQTAITYFLSQRGKVSIQIFDLAGRRVRNIFIGEKSPGVHTVKWDGRDDRGGKAGPGVYFGSLALEGRRISGKVVLLR